MADAIQREDACQGGLELPHGRRTTGKNNAVKIAIDVTQVYLQVTSSDKTSIWRTPYSEKQLRSSGFELLHGRRTVSIPNTVSA